MIRIAFRVDASVRIGTGHLTRCLTLADQLREQGVECLFVHRQHPGHLRDLIWARGHRVVLLPTPITDTSSAGDDDYAGWLGVSAEKDAADTIAALGDVGIDWLVVDHYGLDASWHLALRKRVHHIAVIDDLANRPHDCDLLLDQNFFSKPETRYHGLVSSSARKLLGPQFALLGPEYAAVRQLIRPRRGPLSRVLVYYGGSDLTGETVRAIRVLSRPGFEQLAADVVVGPNTPRREEILRLAHSRDRTTVYGMRDTLLDLAVQADLALGSGGTVTWERCALGLPAVVTAMAPNQVPFNEALAVDSKIWYLGPSGAVTDQDLTFAVEALLRDPARLAAVAMAAWVVTDGLGSQRVADAMLPPVAEVSQVQL